MPTIKKLLLCLVVLSATFAKAQTISVLPATVTTPRGGYQTCEASVEGVNDKTVTWTTTGGSLIGTNPSTLNEPSTIAVNTSTTGTYTLTATSNANGAVTGTCVVTVVASPTPQTGHPRFAMTPSDVAGLQAKAGNACSSGNALYDSGQCALALFYWTYANANWNWSCGGGPNNTKTGQPIVDESASYWLGPVSYEAIAWIYADMAIMDPNDPTYNWGCYANDMWNYYQNYWLSPDNAQYTALTTGGPGVYRGNDEEFGITGNHGSDNTTFLTMTPDWLMGAKIGGTGGPWLGAGSGATLSPGSFLTATITGTATLNSASITGVTVVTGTPQVGLTITNANFPAGTRIIAISGGTYTVTQLATANATGTMTVSGFLPTISAGGTGYLPNGNTYWYMTGGGCATVGHYANFYDQVNQGQVGTTYVAMGTVQVNGSGVVAGSVFPLTNATGCTGTPTITVYSDQQTARNYLAMTAAMAVHIDLTGVRAIVGNYNSSSQFDTGSGFDFVGMRANGNNYTYSKNMYLVAAALTFNDNTTDDPTIPQTTATNTCNAARGTVCADGSASTLHAYWTYETGGNLYRQWAHMEDPNVSWPAYQAVYANLPTKPMCHDEVNNTNVNPLVPCFGDGRHGESVEGVSYGYSFYRMAEALLSIHTAGYDDPLLYGPQMSLGTSAYWDLHFNYKLNLLSYTYFTAQPRFASVFIGDIFNFPQPSLFADNAWFMLYDKSVGRTDRTAKLYWPLVGTSVGGTSAFYQNLNNGYGGEVAFPLFMALPAGNPQTSPPSDPRGSLPLVSYAGANQSIFVRNAWVTNGPESPSDTGSPVPNTQQTFWMHCPNTRIDHEDASCMRFDIESNGEYITKGRALIPEYNYFLNSPEHANTMSFGADPTQTVCTYAGGCFAQEMTQGMEGWFAQTYTAGSIVGYPAGTQYWQASTNTLATDIPGTAGDWTSIATTATKGGGNIFHGQNAANTFLNHSEMPNYIAVNGDTTGWYSGSSAPVVNWGVIAGPSSASRSLIYLRNSKQVAFVDRGIGPYPARNWIQTTGPVTLIGSNTASWPTQSNTQKVYLTSLLSGVTMSDAGGFLTNQNGNPGTDDWEAYSHILEDMGTPTTAETLNVIEWGAAGFTKTATSLVSSSAGDGFNCAKISANMACFKTVWPGTLGGTTIPASSATTMYVADLTPNISISIAAAGAPTSAFTDNAGTLVFTLAGTGNVTLGIPPPTLTSITVTPNPGAVLTIGTLAMSAACLYSDSSTTPCVPTWTDTNAHSTINSSTGLVTGVSAGSDTVTATISAISGNATVNVSAPTLVNHAVTLGPTKSLGVGKPF